MSIVLFTTRFHDRQLTGFRDWAQYTTRSNGRKLLFVYLFYMFWRNKNKKRVAFISLLSQNSTDDTSTQYQMIHSLTHETGSGADRLEKTKQKNHGRSTVDGPRHNTTVAESGRDWCGPSDKSGPKYILYTASSREHSLTLYFDDYTKRVGRPSHPATLRVLLDGI